jgi:hypothetical protein
LADGQDAVVLQDHRLLRAQGLGDLLALAGVQHHAGELLEQGVVVIEGGRVLGQGIQQPAQGRPGLAVQRVRVGGGDHVGPRLVQLGMDGEGGAVQPGRDLGRRLDDLAGMADQHQVRDLDPREVHAERIDPEVVGQFRIAGGDVAGPAHVEAVAAEQAIRRGQPLLAIEPLLLVGGLARQFARAELRQHGLDLGGGRALKGPS